MSDAAQSTAAEVRAAAEAVKAALDHHLAAVERRAGEDDPVVFEAFNRLAAAAEVYDELLYDAYDEVTPFEIPGAEDGLPPYTGPDEPHALSVLIRRDYTVAEPHRLLAQAQRVADLDADVDDGEAPAGESVGHSTHAALGVLFGEFEPDEIATRHKEFGLEEGDSTLWVTAADEPAEPGEWLEAPFEQADPQQIVCRFDVSSVFDEDPDDADEPERGGVRRSGGAFATPGSRSGAPAAGSFDDEALEPLDVDR
ncbi:hypothetical protein DSC45_09285 [Streptomyces sp. YIM 130001]|uniref:hypothetical protein n=1 Tax=Streptomyces sp. YIM 130001 TaxID=2259644 RepID=UPI000EE3D5EE|nr:hypothetical protein [Streptomyces sp. YIM 130001]RII18802.1 hypothetical protein DSC45_09285 [Streptomyces sp. YIM 130001]